MFHPLWKNRRKFSKSAENEKILRGTNAKKEEEARRKKEMEE